MGNKVLRKAMKKAVKVFKKAGYEIIQKNITEGSTISMSIHAEPQNKSK